MKKLLILSGKGGTGKTTLASAFVKLSEAKAYCDCDVDAPNLHLILNKGTKSTNNDFYGLQKALIDNELCTNCGRCIDHCRFDAIDQFEKPKVNAYSCEGCGLCQDVCGENAITMVPHVAGELKLYKNTSVFSTAKLKVGSGNSGLLVSEVKKQINDVPDADVAIIDGSPGIGCPVIASLSGVDICLIVAEPTLSGISDLERIIKTALSLNVHIIVCVNKYDVNLENTAKIEELCREFGLIEPKKIPFDSEVINIINSGKTVVDVNCAAGQSIKQVFNQVMDELININ